MTFEPKTWKKPVPNNLPSMAFLSIARIFRNIIGNTSGLIINRRAWTTIIPRRLIYDTIKQNKTRDYAAGNYIFQLHISITFCNFTSYWFWSRRFAETDYFDIMEPAAGCIYTGCQSVRGRLCRISVHEKTNICAWKTSSSKIGRASCRERV